MTEDDIARRVTDKDRRHAGVVHHAGGRVIVEEIPTDLHFTKFERGSDSVAHISAFSSGEFGAVLRHSNEPKKLLTAIKVNGRVFSRIGTY